MTDGQNVNIDGSLMERDISGCGRVEWAAQPEKRRCHQQNETIRCTGKGEDSYAATSFVITLQKPLNY